MKVWLYRDNINTDMLFPGKYTYIYSKPEEIKPHLLEDLDPEFAPKVKKGDIIIAGKNFGCGSSREQPVIGLKAAGIEAIIAESFARIFFRAAINQGLLLVECPEAVKNYKHGDNIEIRAEKGELQIGNRTYMFPKLSPEINKIIEVGGLLEYTRRKFLNHKAH